MGGGVSWWEEANEVYIRTLGSNGFPTYRDPSPDPTFRPSGLIRFVVVFSVQGRTPYAVGHSVTIRAGAQG